MVTAVTMQDVLTEFLGILVGGIQTVAQGVAAGVVAMAKALFLEYNEGTLVGLNVFGGMIAIFGGIALAITITTRVYIWVTSLGN